MDARTPSDIDLQQAGADRSAGMKPLPWTRPLPDSVAVVSLHDLPSRLTHAAEGGSASPRAWLPCCAPTAQQRYRHCRTTRHSGSPHTFDITQFRRPRRA